MNLARANGRIHVRIFASSYAWWHMHFEQLSWTKCWTYVKIHVMKFASAHVRKYVTARKNLCHVKVANPHLEMNLVFLQQCMSQYVSNFSLHVKICKGRFARSVDVEHLAEYMSDFARLHVRLHIREQTRIQQEFVYQNKCQDFSVKTNARTDVSLCGKKDFGIFACQRAFQNVDVLFWWASRELN